MHNIDEAFNKSNSFSDFSLRYFKYISEIQNKMDLDELDMFENEFVLARESGNTIFVAGNGGSAATAATLRATTAVVGASSTLTFSVDEKISQASTGAIGKVVEWDSARTILYYQQERFGDYGTNGSSGAYVAFSGANQVTGSTSNAYGTPDASADSAVTLAGGATITFSNGYANPELQPDSGKIIYVENRKPISRSSDQTEDIKLIVEF